MLSVGYKNVIGARRASWRILSSIEDKERSQRGDANGASIATYRVKVEKELDDICQEILAILDEHLIVEHASDESKVFYYKMKGDYYRYLAEFLRNDERAKATGAAETAYAEATGVACASEPDKGLPPTHPIRLGLALNFSVFHFEIQNKPQEACALAKRALTRHRRARHALGGLQGLHAHHAAPARQPHAVDLGHRRRGRARGRAVMRMKYTRERARRRRVRRARETSA